MRLKIYAWLWLALATPVTATELTHHFISPDFGGNAGNGAYLMNEASAQNKLKDTPVVIPQKSALETFKANLQSAILSKVANSTASSLIDNTGAIALNRNIDIGGYSVVTGDIINGNVEITINDGIGSTKLTVPYIAK